MGLLNEWGVGFIVWVQSLNPALDAFFKTINFLQTEEFFLIALPIVWWCVNKRMGAALAILFLFCDYQTRVLKGITQVARPYDVEPRIRNLDPQADPSFPSAGAMGAMIFWGYLATQFRRRTFWVFAVAVIFIVGFTRVYLGVHYPSDVIASFIIGAVVIAIVVAARVADRLAALPWAWLLGIAFPIGLAVIQLNPETAVTLGAMLGFNIGLLLEGQFVGFEPRTTWGKQIIKIVLGLAVGLGIRLALKPLLPDAHLFTLVRYAVIGLWMGAGAPWVFALAHLSTKHLHVEPSVQPRPGPALR